MELLGELACQLNARIVYFDKKINNLFRDGMIQQLLDKNYIFISTDNSEKQCENILLHELGHIYYEHKHYEMHSWGWSNRQEYEANHYMIKQRADQWLAQYDWEPQVIDIEAFLDYFELEHCHFSIAEIVFHELLSYNKLGAYEM